MTIKCIDNSNVEGSLKLDQEYEPIGEENGKYILKLGKGIKAKYLKTRFKEVN